MSVVKVQFKGMKELDKAIQRLPEEFKRRAYRSVLSTGARVIAKNVKRNINDDEGILRRSIGIKVNPKTNTPYARIGPKRGVIGVNKRGKSIRATTYAKNVEFGTSTAAATPFIRPGVDSSGSEAMSKMQKGFERFLTRAVAKVKSRK
jgi:HK97 gp10 family phage protein